MDHDALFKWLLKDPVILRSFFEEFLPEVARYFFAYQRLDKKKALKVGEEMGKLSPEMISEKELDRWNPFVLIGERRGIRQGRQVGESTLVLRQLRRRLGPLPEARRRAIEKLSLHKIEALGEALLDFDSPDDLSRWLQRNTAPAATRKTAKPPKRSRGA